MEPLPSDSRVKLGDIAAAAGLSRIHLLAWRDLDDVEAGGSEVHAANVARLWAEAPAVLRLVHVVSRRRHARLTAAALGPAVALG